MPKYYIKYVSPKYSKADGKVFGYTIRVENDKGYNHTDTFTVDDMKTLYGCNNERECLNLAGKECDLITTIKIK